MRSFVWWFSPQKSKESLLLSWIIRSQATPEWTVNLAFQKSSWFLFLIFHIKFMSPVFLIYSLPCNYRATILISDIKYRSSVLHRFGTLYLLFLSPEWLSPKLLKRWLTSQFSTPYHFPREFFLSMQKYVFYPCATLLYLFLHCLNCVPPKCTVWSPNPV